MEQKLNEYDIYGTRLLLFVEIDPQSNTYRQVCLSAEEFKNVSLAFGKVVSREGNKQEIELQMSEETYDLPDFPEMHE